MITIMLQGIANRLTGEVYYLKPGAVDVTDLFMVDLVVGCIKPSINIIELLMARCQDIPREYGALQIGRGEATLLTKVTCKRDNIGHLLAKVKDHPVGNTFTPVEPWRKPGCHVLTQKGKLPKRNKGT